MKRHVIINDLHIPYHLKEIVEHKLPMYLSDLQPDGFIINGDLMDINSISRYNKYRDTQYTLGQEYEFGCEILDLFDSVLPKECEKVILYGNHEERFDRFVLEEGKKLGSALLTVEQGLKLKERGYEVIDDYLRGCYKLGDYLYIRHGERFSINYVKDSLTDYEQSIVLGHAHRTQTYFTGKHLGIGLGGLFDKENHIFRYAKNSQINKWSNSFATISVEDGFFYPEIHEIENNRFRTHDKFY